MTLRRSPRLPGILALVALAAPAVAAPPPKVSVQADRKDAQVGQPVLVTVRVRGVEETAPAEVKPPALDGAKVAQVGQPAVVPTLAADLEAKGVFHPGAGQHMVNALKGVGKMPDVGALDPEMAKLIGDPNLLKGRQATRGIAGLDTNDYTFTYQVTPDRTGRLTVPGFTVSANGQTLATPPLTLDVTEAKAQPWVRMALSLSNPTPIVGEEVQLHVDLLIQRREVTLDGKTYPHLPLRGVSLTLPGLDGSGQFELLKPLEEVVRENAVVPPHRGYRVNSIPGEMKFELEPAGAKGADLDPARYRRRMSVPLRVREGGAVTLAAAHAAGEVCVSARGNKGQWEPFVVASEPLTVTALDLRRRADRPADFTGAIGSVRVTARASQMQMPAGTPFSLTLRLEGSGVASATPPDLAARPEFAKGFRVRTEEAHTVAGGAREFTYTLRPLSEDVTEVPSVPVGYFDPKTNSFGTAHSEPIPLRVSAAQNATPDAPAAPQAGTPPPAAADEPEGGFRFDSLLRWAEGAIALGCVACAAVWAVRRWRRRREGGVRREPLRAVVTEARRQLSAPAPTFAGVRQTLQDFLRRHFRLPPGEVTPHDAAEYLRRGGVPEGLARSFAALLDTCATGEFAPGVVNTSPSELAAYARQLMDQILAAIPEVVV